LEDEEEKGKEEGEEEDGADLFLVHLFLVGEVVGGCWVLSGRMAVIWLLLWVGDILNGEVVGF
jgi:hypothetical protein